MSGSKVSIAACGVILALSLVIAGVAVAETTVERAATTVEDSPAAGGSAEQEVSTRAAGTEQQATVARTPASAPESATRVESNVPGVEVNLSGPGRQEVQVTGGNASAQVRVTASQGVNQRVIRSVRSDNDLALRVPAAGGKVEASPSETFVTPEAPEGTPETPRVEADSRQQVHQVQSQQVRAPVPASQQTERGGTGQRVAAERPEARIRQATPREATPSRSTPRLLTDPGEVEDKLRRLQGREKRDLISTKPATATPRSPAAGSGLRSRELQVAREDITARSVPRISSKRYEKLYRKAAREYGFADDWYILAAVGKVESNHGRNLGPSSAGAMGPMQFLPSTWEAYGLDGNGDGVANIMDPEDAIPAAASYLQAGGAPEDWYEALYTYNRAGWYVKKVLRVAEAYRDLAGDYTVGPYT